MGSVGSVEDAGAVFEALGDEAVVHVVWREQGARVVTVLGVVDHRATPEKRAAREAYVENALETFPVLAFDEPSARIFASIDAALSATGNRLAVEDLMIAATALAGGHDVVTGDLRSFPRVPGLKWIRW